MSERNPYQLSRADVSAQQEAEFREQNDLSGDLHPRTVFLWSYGTSLCVGISVAVIWLVVVHGVIPLPGKQTREIARWGFLFSATLPSMLTSLCFSFCYCFVVRGRRAFSIWPAVLFGGMSGLAFNAITAIAFIESVSHW